MKKDKRKEKKKNFLLNKKGFSMISEGEKLLFWGLIVIVLTVCALLIYTWTNTLKGIYLNDVLAPTAYEARFIYSDECFAYADEETGRVYTGTIDISKFTQNRFYECLPFEGLSDPAMSAKLELNDGTTYSVSSSNWNDKTSEVTRTTYIVNVYGYGPGMLTFYHES